MAYEITGEAVVQRALQKAGLGTVMKSGEFTLEVGAVTSLVHLRNGNLAPNYHRDRRTIIYWPGNPTGMADYVRYAGALTPSTGALAPDAVWADGTEGSTNMYLLPRELHPVRLVDALQRALSEAYFENSEPLSLAKDAGMQASGTGDWTVGATGTLSTVTTAGSENVFSGLASKRFQSAATGDYFMQRFSVHPGELMYVAALARSAVGTAKVVLWDVENDVEIQSEEAPEHTGKAWAFMYRTATMPAGCETLEVRLTGEESSADTYWNGLWVWPWSSPEGLRMRLSSTWDTAFKMPALAHARWGQPVSGANKVSAGFGMQLTEIPSSQYGFLFERPGPNPNAIQFHTSVLNEYGGIYIQGRRAYSDLTTFTLALSQTTACPINIAEALLRIELLQDDEIGMKQTDRDRKLARARDDLRQAQQVYYTEGPAAEVEDVIWPFATN